MPDKDQTRYQCATCKQSFFFLKDIHEHQKVTNHEGIRGFDVKPNPDQRVQCSSTKNGTRCRLTKGHPDAHKADTGSEIIDWHDSDATDPKAGVEPDEERPRLTVIRDPYPHERGGEGRFGHMLFYRWKYRGMRNRVVPKDE